MYEADSYNAITPEMEKAIEQAARRLGADLGDVQGYFLAGGDWDADTPEELADLIVTSWNEQEAS